MSGNDLRHVVRPKFPRPKGDGNGSTPVVRLAARPQRVSSATVLKKHAVHTPVVSLRIPTHTRDIHAEPMEGDGVRTMLRYFFSPRKHQMLSASLGMTFASGMIGKFATVLLIPMLLLQPLLPVYAADETVAAPESAPVSAPVVETPVQEVPPAAPDAPVENAVPPVEETTTPVPTDSSADTPVSSASDDEAATDEATSEEITPVPPEDIPTDAEETTTDAATEATSEEVTPTPPEETPVAEEIAGDATTTEAISEEVIPQQGGGGSAPEVVDDSASTTETDTGTSTPPESVTGGSSSGTATAPSTNVSDATTTASDIMPEEEVIAPTEEVPVVVEEATVRASAEEAARLAEEARQEQIRQTIKKEVVSEFTKGCLTLDGVGYYCLKNFDGSAAGALTPSTAVTGVTSQKDPSGNYKQIFITRGGENVQLTHDAWDSTFPSMDVSGKSVVWQGMTEGRWQIFIADVSGTGTPVITQLTHGTESNFNPRVDSDTIVWQGWVNGNWEIFLAERLLPAAYYPLRPDTPQDPGGGLPDENRMLGIDNTWHVTRLTTNDTHDMFPAIAAGLVTWQSSQGGSWNVYAYSMKSGATTKLSQDGTKSENPRFAVTWDEHDANGNARMVGYDIASGKTIDITNEARNTPSGSAPYRPTETPISQPNQAALPSTSSGTSTTMKVDGDADGGTNTFGT